MNRSQAQQHLSNLRGVVQELRAKERGLKARAKALSQIPTMGSGQGSDIAELERNFKKFLPESHIPGNVGGINRATWPFYYVSNFDFGARATYNDTVSQSQQFQVSQEAALILMSVSRMSTTALAEGAPLNITFRDRQSTRQLVDLPIPFQSIGLQSRPTIFSTPYLLMPNAKFETVLSGFTPFGVTIAGENIHQIMFFGYRIRVQDADKVLTAVFGK